MGKNKEYRAQISACIDPRFMGSFQRKSDNSEKDTTSTEKKSDPKKETEQTQDGNEEFRRFLSKKLFEFVDSQYKEIEVSNDSSDLFHYDVENVCLFNGSGEISDVHNVGSTVLPPKKKKKKEKDNIREQIKEIAVTADWVRERAKLFSS